MGELTPNIHVRQGLMFMLGAIMVLIVILLLPEKIIAGNIDTPLQTEESREKPSPQDYLDSSQIHVYRDRVVIDVSGIKWATFENTKSMLPFLDEHSNALQIEPVCPEEVSVGDIVSYKSKYSDGIIIHRVVFKGEDDEGIYFIIKGDNNPSNDPGKIRCSQIQRRLIGILY